MRKMIDMAREAGMTGLEAGGLFDNFLVFEALVRADERERVMNEPLTKAQWQRFEDEIRADEREACAKVCETYNKRQCYNDEDMTVANECAAAIRARGNT